MLRVNTAVYVGLNVLVRYFAVLNGLREISLSKRHSHDSYIIKEPIYTISSVFPFKLVSKSNRQAYVLLLCSPSNGTLFFYW